MVVPGQEEEAKEHKYFNIKFKGQERIERGGGIGVLSTPGLAAMWR